MNRTRALARSRARNKYFINKGTIKVNLSSITKLLQRFRTSTFAEIGERTCNREIWPLVCIGVHLV